MKNPRTAHQHLQQLAAAGVLLLAVLTACREAAPPLSDEGAIGSPQQQSMSSTSQEPADITQRRAAMPALETVLRVFASPDGEQWASYDSVEGIVWRDATRLDSPGSQSAPFKRAGNILLSGFGMVDVPNGKTGAEAGSRQDNEGNSGITLLGTADQVESIAVMKFYPSQDYAGILKNQFGSGAAIELLANACGGPGAEDPEAREFYHIAIPGAAGVYAEIHVDAEGGKYSPGSTTFEFHRSEPTDRIKSLDCTVIGKN